MNKNQFDLWDLLINNYIKQDDLVSSVIYLNKHIKSLCEKKLYKKLKFTCNPYRNYKKIDNTYVYGFKNTIINGFSKKGDYLNKKDQSDHILYSKILNLLHTNNVEKINKYTEIIHINDDCFYYNQNNEIFSDLMNKMNQTGNKSLKQLIMNIDDAAYDIILKSSLLKFENLKTLDINTIDHFKLIPDHLATQIEKLTLKNIDIKVSLENFTNLNHIVFWIPYRCSIVLFQVIIKSLNCKWSFCTQIKLNICYT